MKLGRGLGYLYHRLPKHWRRATALGDPSRRTPGLPNGLDREVLDRLMERRGEKPATEIFYEHLSNWKPTGAYRVIMRRSSGRPWSVIFKNADYSADSVPAQVGLPAVIGRPEYRILSSAGPSLQNFLPEIHWTDRIESRQCFRHITEDLHGRWYRPVSPADLLAIVTNLPSLQRSLAETVGGDDSGLVHYDASYSSSLRKYVQDSVDAFLVEHPDPRVEDLWEGWSALASVHEEAAPTENVRRLPIHGDFNTANLYLHWRNRTRLKAVDWEWTGIGYLHTDLASVLKHASADTEAEGLRMFSAAYSELSPQQHRRLYAWCRLQDAIRDAGYVAAQFLDFDHTPRVDPSAYVGSSLVRSHKAARMVEEPS